MNKQKTALPTSSSALRKSLSPPQTCDTYRHNDVRGMFIAFCVHIYIPVVPFNYDFIPLQE